MTARIAGYGGAVLAGHQHAARLGRWTIVTTTTVDAVTVDIEAASEQLDAFWSTQRPLGVQISIAARAWIWRNVEPISSGTTWRFHCDTHPEVQ